MVCHKNVSNSSTIQNKHIMKKILFLSLMLLSVAYVNAQDNKNCEAKRAECVEMHANKLAADMGLNDATKAKFVALYTEYANKIHEVCGAKCDKKCDAKCDSGKCADCKKGGNCGKCPKAGKCQKKCPKALTDAEAQEALQKRLDKEAKSIEKKQKRLEIDKKYTKEFQKILTPQQTLQVMKSSCCKGKKQGKKAGPRNFGKNMKQFQRGQFGQRPGAQGGMRQMPGAAVQHDCGGSCPQQ